MPKNNHKKIRLAFLGDIFLGQSPATIAPELQKLLNQCHQVIANLESSICPPSPIHSPKVLLRSEPGVEAALSEWGVSAVTIANNHIFDHGDKGFRSTCEALESLHIPFAGAGMNAAKAASPLTIECGGFRLGIIACTEPGTQAKIASNNDSGCHCIKFPELSSQITSLKKQVDFVIVTSHWGFCDYAYPPQKVVENGDRILAAGADLVVGHHSHSVQGFKKGKNGQVIYYSLGDFYFGDYDTHGCKVTCQGESSKGLVLFVDLSTSDLPLFRYEFTQTKNNIINVDMNRTKREIEFQKRTAPLKSAASYSDFWRSVVRTRFKHRLYYWMNPLKWRHVRAATVHAAFLMVAEVLFNRIKRKQR